MREVRYSGCPMCRGRLGRYCRETNTPYFGICLGLQTAVISYCRDVLGFEDANSAEFDPSAETQCCVFMPEVSTAVMGGGTRLARWVGLKSSAFEVL